MTNNLLNRLALSGLAGLLSLSHGCTSLQPQKDSYGRIVGYERKYDEELTSETFGFIKFILSTSTGLGLAESALSETQRNLASMRNLGNAVGSLAKIHRSDNAVYEKLDVEPHGFRELRDRVEEAINDPKKFADYLQLDMTDPKPEEVKRLEDNVGTWISNSDSEFKNMSYKAKFRSETKTKLLENGWLLYEENKIKQSSGKETIGKSIAGWNPSNRKYVSLSSGTGETTSSFGEGTSIYDRRSNSWNSSFTIITSNGYFIKGTGVIKYEGDTRTAEATTNFGTSKSTAKRIKN